MHRLVLGFFAATVLSASAGAQSGPAANTWSGVYIGAGVGGHTFDRRSDNADGFHFAGTVGKGGLATIITGFDFQHGKFVLGGFVDYGWQSSAHKRSTNMFGSPFQERTVVGTSLSVGARIGLLSSPSTLWYVPFGYTYATNDREWSDRAASMSNFGDLSGVFGGLGIETMLGQHWSLRGEYRFTQYGDQHFPGSRAPYIAPTTTMHADQSGRIVAAYRLGGTGAAQSSGAPRQPAAWTGAYVGAGLGFAITDQRREETSPFGRIEHDGDGGHGALGSVIAGYDIQLGPWFVAGAFAEFERAHARLASKSPWGAERSFGKDDALSVGGRVGAIVTGDTAWYIPAGYTWSTFRNDRYYMDRNDQYKFGGWFAGLGAETQLGAGWSLRGEYRFTQLGKECVPCDNGNVLNMIQPSEQTGRAILTYKLGGQPAQ